MTDKNRLRSLFAEYATGTISEDLLQTLQAAMREDAELRREFIEYMNVDSALADVAALSEAEIAEIQASENAEANQLAEDSRSKSLVQSNTKPREIRRAAAILVAVAAILLLVLIPWFSEPADDAGTAVATLVDNVDAMLVCDGESWEDTELNAGTYQLNEGLLHLQFDGGVSVFVEAPARFDAVSGKRVILHRGRLSASVPPEGIGFAVDTPEAEVVDFGTEFSVDVTTGKSEVHVFDGLVRVHSKPNDGDDAEAIDLRTSEAVKIDDDTKTLVSIELATDRFVRSFDEPGLNYSKAIRKLSPVAYYRMPIRKGFSCKPPAHSGELIWGDGVYPPKGPGFMGGSLRVGGESRGRGARVTNPPPLDTGRFTMTASFYAMSRSTGAIVVGNLDGDEGCFALSINESGRLMATVRADDGELVSCSADSILPLKQWCQLAMTVDGEHLSLFQDGELICTTECRSIAKGSWATLWFGTDVSDTHLWDGRIDEVALFDKALDASKVDDLYQIATKQIAESK